MPDNPSTRTPLVIDGDLRTITVPTDYVFGVYNDKDVLAVPFVCPRYIDDIDLSELSIRVNFTNSVGTSSYYDVPSADVTINTDTIEFTWLLGSAVFTGSGKVTFAVCLRKIEEDGRITREFNTTLASAKVLEGLEVENQNDPAQYSILTALQSIADSVNSSIESADEYAEQLKNYVGSPLVANTSTDMVDVSRVYVYTGNETGYSNGHWYYYNNAAWHDGGNYNAVANGIYPDLTAGNVLLGRTQSDRVPYLLRKTGNRLNKVGYSCYETIVGASVGWNQQAKEFASDNWVVVGGGSVSFADSIATFTPSAQYSRLLRTPSVVDGHKYFLTVDIKAYSGAIMNIALGTQTSFRNQGMTIGTGTIADANWHNYYKIGAFTAGTDDKLLFQYAAASDFNAIQLKNAMLVDLTQMLGTSIADYIYSLESATAGSGIVKLREWGFCTGYVPYNAGSIESVEVTEKKVVGFNQWDEEAESGYYKTYSNGLDGGKASSNTYERCKYLIPVLPNTAYNLTKPSTESDGSIGFYDINGNYLDAHLSLGASRTLSFTTPSNAYKMSYYIKGSITGSCINISSDRNGEYEPYHEYTYDLGTDTLRGIFKLDANNNLYADGDTKTSDGVITRKYGVVTLDGTEAWTADSNSGRFYHQLNEMSKQSDYRLSMICDSMTVFPNSYSQAFTDATIGITGFNDTRAQYPNQNWIYAKANGLTVAADFKAWLASHPLTVVYLKATPTTEQSTPFTSPQTVYPDGTEEFVTTNSVPVGHETNYPYDMKSISEELLDIPDVPSTNGTYVLKATRSASGLTYTWVTG